MPDFLYVIFLIIAIFIKNAFSAIKKTQENLSSLQIQQERQKENIEQLWEQNAFLEAKVEKQNDLISSLNDKIKKQENYIQRVEKENQELRKNLEFYTEIEKDSTRLNSEEVSVNKDSKQEDCDTNSSLDEQKLDKEQQYAFDLLNQTNKNLFITGQAGTGKSFLLKEFAKKTDKKILLLAPTGIAAINIQGVTLHSAFGYDNLSTLSLEQINKSSIKLKKEKISLLKAVDIFIIDEISMVRSDILEKINKILQIIMRDNKPFGGKRLVLFGDLYQLPPIAKKEEIKYLKDNFGGIFFFLSDAYKNGNFEFIELTINHRQEKDKTFFDILNNIRQDNVTDKDIEELNKRFCSDISTLRRVIKLFSRKKDVDETNKTELDKIKAKEYIYKSVVTFLQRAEQSNFDKSFPIADELKLKNGALVMMVTNDPSKQWVNGTLGIVKKLTTDSITVVINGREYSISQAEFTQQEAVYKNGRIEYIPIMTVKQFPLVLAYAITIHKSQGMTYQQIACDVSDTFTNGQAYVALSRCTTLNGLYLLKKISKTSVFSVDDDVKEFYQSQINLLNNAN